jgi:hypothetical protein
MEKTVPQMGKLIPNRGRPHRITAIMRASFRRLVIIVIMSRGFLIGVEGASCEYDHFLLLRKTQPTLIEFAVR